MLPSSSRGRGHVGRTAMLAVSLTLAGLLNPVGDSAIGPRPAAASSCDGVGSQSGVDVSFYQGAIDWGAVAAAGIGFGIARIADGLNYPDATFETNYAGMRAHGITPGAYLFWEPAQDPVAQANVVLRALRAVGFDIGDLAPTLDVEVTGGQSPATIAQRLRTTVTTIEKAIGVAPLIYASPVAWNLMIGSGGFGDLPLWVAHWATACPTMPMGWSTWTLWQYSSKGSVPGIAGPVDLDQTQGSSLPLYTGAPVFAALPELTVEGLGPTRVTYGPRAVGYRGLQLDADCAPASGTVFPIGTWTVTCSASHYLGSATGSFKVTVRLPKAPAFESPLPEDIDVAAAGPNGTPVSWGSVTAKDFQGTRIPVDCLPAAGSLFPVGQWLVTCRGSDSFGQDVKGTFTVSVGYRFQDLLPESDPALVSFRSTESSSPRAWRRDARD